MAKNYFVYKYAGDNTRLGAHGYVETGDELHLSEFEHTYQKQNPNKNFVFLKRESTPRDSRLAYMKRVERRSATRLAVNVALIEQGGKAKQADQAMQIRNQKILAVIGELDKSLTTRPALLEKCKEAGLEIVRNPTRAQLLRKLAEKMTPITKPAEPVADEDE